MTRHAVIDPVTMTVMGVVCLLLAACSSFKHSPSATVLPSGQIIASGDAATPAHVNETSTHVSLPVPMASTITSSPGNDFISVHVSQPTTLTMDAKHTSVDGPVAFTPPAPPTPAQVAQGSVLKWFALGGLGCLILAGWLAYAQHYLAAIKIAMAGIALPVLGRFFSSQIALVAGSILVTAGIVFVIAWYVIERQKKPETIVLPIPSKP